MSVDDPLGALRSRALDGPSRARAAQRLAGIDSEAARRALTEVATSEDDAVEVVRAAAAALAANLFKAGKLDEAPLADFVGEAYLAFDQAVSALLREK